MATVAPLPPKCFQTSVGSDDDTLRLSHESVLSLQ